MRSRHHSGNGGGGGGGSSGGNNGNNGGGNGGGSSGYRDSGNKPRSASSLRSQSFDSNCGDLRVRGNAWQVYEKYQALARDATSASDRVTAENYLQHAEHYYRLIEAINEATAQEQRPRENSGTYAPQGAQQPPSQGMQPEMPAHYYGAPPPPPQAPQTVRTSVSGYEQQPAPPADQGEAVVQPRYQPPAFFTQEEIEEHNDVPPLATAR